MHYDPILDPEFSSSMGTYLKNYINHDPTSDEAIARYRRFNAFINASGLVEEHRIPSFKHRRIEKMILPARDHISYYWFGGIGRIPFVLTEPYSLKDFEIKGVRCFRLPWRISPYGGTSFNTPFTTKSGLLMATRSLLFVREIHSKYLVEVSEQLMTGVEKLPFWNSVTEAERSAAELRSKSLYQSQSEHHDD